MDPESPLEHQPEQTGSPAESPPAQDAWEPAAASAVAEPAPDAPAAASRAAHEDRPHRHHASLRDYAESLLVTVILALFATTFVVQAFKIPSPSMEKTLLVGDHLLVNKFIYGGRGAWYEKLLPYKPISRRDIIVFKFPYDDHIHYVKRVIGIPGDRIRIVDHQLYVNGKKVDEPYKVLDENVYDPFGDNFPPPNPHFPASNVRPEWKSQILDFVDKGDLVVPPQKYFVMGDNRDRSWDSRFWGFVDRENVIGRPLIIYWSVNATSDEYADRTLSGRATGFIHTLAHLPALTRWNRMFRSVR
jgi:signal peptidase I